MSTLQSTFKSRDTEEWLDIRFTRPVGYLWAKLFEKLGVHPNVVTLLSIILGAGAAVCFYFENYWVNVIGILCLMWANFYDSADGQLARMTGQKTRLGRVLDGFAGDVWFFCIYLAICLRLTPTWEWWIWGLCAVAGFLCHGPQCQLADYYRNVHLYVVEGAAKSELHRAESLRQEYERTSWRGNLVWKIFLFFYERYTRGQERRTPAFQKFREQAEKTYGAAFPEPLRQAFRKGSLHLVAYANILTFNTRAIALYASLLLTMPWLYPLFEILVLQPLCYIMQHRHEMLCQRLTQKIIPTNETHI